MLSAPTQLSVEQYLEFEARAPERHEYVDGRLLAMAGETQEHEEIFLNIVEALRPQARARGCRLYSTNIKLQVRPTRFRYPDLMVICGPKEASRIEFAPCLIVEVLSDGTEQTDLSDKLNEYTALPQPRALPNHLPDQQTGAGVRAAARWLAAGDPRAQRGGLHSLSEYQAWPRADIPRACVLGQFILV
ncbi:Uma2 family endonuclease [Meiothermus sp.]|uniref:Uma2 family endonuclease n=1 Tax=Meiothermus sp. TaxID=1955249 RepID=UPI00307DE6B4